jgi:hypothetical protein
MAAGIIAGPLGSVQAALMGFNREFFTGSIPPVVLSTEGKIAAEIDARREERLQSLGAECTSS